jgi:protein-disulfide isomerase
MIERSASFPLRGIASTLCVLAVMFLGAPRSLAEPTTPADPASDQTLEQAIERYIRSHPEVIEQSLQSLEVKRQDSERQRARAAIATRQNDLLNDPSSPVSGNPAGDITLVEFFDYRCGYCKRVAGAVTQLQKDNPRVRVVYKDFPILGESSELAAKAALASRAQGKHQAFHEALPQPQARSRETNSYASPVKSASTPIVSKPTWRILNGKPSSTVTGPWPKTLASAARRASSSERNSYPGRWN